MKEGTLNDSERAGEAFWNDTGTVCRILWDSIPDSTELGRWTGKMQGILDRAYAVQIAGRRNYSKRL